MLMMHRGLLLLMLLVLSRNPRDGRRLRRVERRVSLLLLLLLVLLVLLLLVLLLLLLLLEVSSVDAAVEAVAGRDSRVIRVSGRGSSGVGVEDGLDVRRRSGEAKLAVASGSRVRATVSGVTALNGALHSRRRREELAIEGGEDVGEGVGAGTEGAGVEVDLREEEKGENVDAERGKKENDAPFAERGTPRRGPDSSRGSRRSIG